MLPLLQPEIDFLGFYVPWILVMIVFGFLTAWSLTMLLEHLGLTRFIWHLPLFFFALCVLCTSLWGLFFTP